MGDVPMVQVHRMFFHYSEYPLSLRALYTCTLIVLGLGYVFAMLHVFNSHAARDGKPGISVEDLIIAYSGSKENSRLEAALNGPMRRMMPTHERNIIASWVRRGAELEEYRSTVEPLIRGNCMDCHDGKDPHIPEMDAYEKVKELAKVDTGADIFTLIRVSHIHLFGITFIFFLMGYMYSHSFVRPVWFKVTVIVVPFAAVILDIGSWYLTKLFAPFAWVVLIGGGLMGVSFAFMWITCIYQMWFFTPPEEFEHIVE